MNRRGFNLNHFANVNFQGNTANKKNGTLGCRLIKVLNVSS
jgi:hypothetical protein